MRFVNLTIYVAVAGMLSTGVLWASDPHPKNVTKPQLISEPLLDLGAELGGKNIPPSSAPKHPAPEAHAKSERPSHAQGGHETSKTPKKAASWGYLGDEGPQNWGKLSSDYGLCGSGKNQSPINIIEKQAVGTTRMGGFEVHYRDAPLKILNNGHAIQVNYPLGSYINLGGKRYELMHYEFHTPSEHQKNGFNYPMEVQLVHQDSKGQVAVLAIIFQEGAENPLLDDMMMYLPTKLNHQRIYKDVLANPARFFPKNKHFYQYNGSLSAPPCSEGVYWAVFKHTIEASADQIQQMKEVMGENARPVQMLNARTLLKSYADKDSRSEGVYEFY